MSRCPKLTAPSIIRAVALLLFLNLVPPLPVVQAQGPSTDQHACLNAFNKDFAKTAASEGKSVQRCIRDFAKGKLGGTAEACLTADRRGKVVRAKDKAAARFHKNCVGMDQGGSPRLAPFGMRVPAVANMFAVITHTTLADRVFGSGLDTATAYATELMLRIDALADAFPNTVTALYLNWLPGNTTAMLDAITVHAKARHVGIGGPDIHPDVAIKAYPYYPGYHGVAPIMVEAQWDNFDHTVPPGDTDALLGFAVDNLWVNYVCWLARPGFEVNLLATIANPDFAAEFPVDPTR